MAEIVVFHVSHIQNSKSIERYGILSRTEIQKRGNIKFTDIADKNLIKNIQVQREFNLLDPNQSTITKINLKLSEYVPFHFIRPVNRPEIVPADVYRWQNEYPNGLDYWVLNPDFLLKDKYCKYLICIGHWNSTWYGGPLFLNNFKIFVDLIQNPSILRDILQKIPNSASHFKKTFEEDIPNILEGRVKAEYLGDGKYKHLMGSSIFIEKSVPKSYLMKLPSTKKIKQLPAEWKITIELKQTD